MISKDMYTLLKTIPPLPECVEWTDLLNRLLNEKQINPSLGSHLIEEAESNGFIKRSSRTVGCSYIKLLYKGVIAIEEYENKQKSDDLMEKAYKTSQYAMWAAIASAITAIIALFK